MTFEEKLDAAMKVWGDLRESGATVIYLAYGSCSRAAGADPVKEALEALLDGAGDSMRLVLTGCPGLCSFEPVISVQAGGNPPVAYGPVGPGEATDIVKAAAGGGDYASPKLLGVAGEPFGDLPALADHVMMKGQVRVLTSRTGVVDPVDLDHFIANGGFAGLVAALAKEPDAVIEDVLASGLWGRGGAKFPAGRKWKFTRDAPGDKKFIICNGSEGDPGSFMDRILMEGDPYAVVEGMVIAAYAVGASEGYLYVQNGYPLAAERLSAAIDRAADAGLVGENILGSGFDFTIHLKAGAGAFVCGEETALMQCIEGRRGNPRLRPPFPPQKGLWDHPTVINNVKTLATVPWVMARGPEWYPGHAIADGKTKGTAMLALSGALERTGLVEVPTGTTMDSVLKDMAGGIRGGKKLKAVQTESPLGAIVPASAIEGEGGFVIEEDIGMVVMDQNTCMPDMVRAIMTFTQGESCGKCSPCRVGTKKMLGLLEDICSGVAPGNAVDIIEDMAWTMQRASICALGQSAAKPVLCAVEHFRDEFDDHMTRRQKCPSGVCDDRVAAAPPPGEGGEDRKEVC